MIDIKISVLAAILLSVTLLGGGALGASITGDDFTAAVSEDDFELGSVNGVAGMAGTDAVVVDTGAFAAVEWLDDDTFELDFYSIGPKVTWVLSSLDFTESGAPVDIIGVSEASSDFGWSYTSSFTANSITIEYPNLNATAIGDGEIISFDVLTAPVPEPSGIALLCAAVGGLFVARRMPRRSPTLPAAGGPAFGAVREQQAA